MTIAALAPRQDFPVLRRMIAGRPVVYLDSAATSLKPQAVIDAVTRFYVDGTANVNRGFHQLGQEASELYATARTTIARFIHARVTEIAFTSGTTEAVNLVAAGLAIADGDNIVASVSEHHSNLLPWMRRAAVRLVPLGTDGRIDVDQLAARIDDRTRMVAASSVSNVTGAIHPIRDIVEAAHRRGVPVFVDAAQHVPHMPVDVAELGCDFLAFSSHKMLGPSGVGVLYARADQHHRITPVKLGGGAVHHVGERDYTLKQPPASLEAGTPNIEGVLGLAAAASYLDALGMERVARHGTELVACALERLRAIPSLHVVEVPRAPTAVGIISVFHEAIDADRLAIVLSDSYGVMARSGTHCAHAYFRACGIPSTLRLSLHVYSDESDVVRACEGIAAILRSAR